MLNVVRFPRGVPSLTEIGGTSFQEVLGATLKFPVLSSGGTTSTAWASASGVTAILPPRLPCDGIVALPGSAGATVAGGSWANVQTAMLQAIKEIAINRMLLCVNI